MLLIVFLACAGPRAVDAVPPVAEESPTGTNPVAVAAPPAPPAPQDPVVAATAGGQESDPAALYEQCRVRVEGVSEPGECATDADCARAGCSSEVCVATARKAESVTTCEILPCFDVLSSCGCVEGVCAWSVGPAAGRTRVQLPPR